MVVGCYGNKSCRYYLTTSFNTSTVRSPIEQQVVVSFNCVLIFARLNVFMKAVLFKKIENDMLMAP